MQYHNAVEKDASELLEFCPIMPSDGEAAAEAMFTKIAASHLCDYDSFEYLIEAGFDVARSIEHPIPDWDSRVVSHNLVVLRELKCHVCFEWTLNSGTYQCVRLIECSGTRPRETQRIINRDQRPPLGGPPLISSIFDTCDLWIVMAKADQSGKPTPIHRLTK